MSYLTTVTLPDVAPTAIGEYTTITDALFACQKHLSDAWEATHGSDKFLDPYHAYDRGQFAHWNGTTRLYVSMPNGDTAHYDVTRITR